MQSVKRKRGFDNCFAVDQNGLSGGLPLTCMNDVDFFIVSHSIHHIDCDVMMEDDYKYHYI